MVEETEKRLKVSIISTLKGSKPINVKALRKLILLSEQLDEKDKSMKKNFKKVILSLESRKKIVVEEDGTVKLLKRGKRKLSNEEEDTCTTKHIKTSNDSSNKEEEGVTRLFVGNLPFAIDEKSLCSHLLNAMTHVKWITDKETGRFYGSAFVEMRSSSEAAKAVTLNGSLLTGRPLKITYAPARPGDVWPPTTSSSKNASSKESSDSQKKMSEKPADCKRLFVGNVSFDIDDDILTKFFENVGAEVKAIRWLHHQSTGDFKGCGFVEFWNEESCTKAAALNTKHLLGRPIRIDWSD